MIAISLYIVLPEEKWTFAYLLGIHHRAKLWEGS